MLSQLFRSFLLTQSNSLIQSNALLANRTVALPADRPLLANEASSQALKRGIPPIMSDYVSNDMQSASLLWEDWVNPDLVDGEDDTAQNR